MDRYYDNTDVDFNMTDYHQLMGKSYAAKGDIEYALEHLYQCTSLTMSKYGNGSVMLVPCYVEIAKVLQHIDPALEELASIDTNTFSGLCQYIKGLQM